MWFIVKTKLHFPLMAFCHNLTICLLYLTDKSPQINKEICETFLYTISISRGYTAKKCSNGEVRVPTIGIEELISPVFGSRFSGLKSFDVTNF